MKHCEEKYRKEKYYQKQSNDTTKNTSYSGSEITRQIKVSSESLQIFMSTKRILDDLMENRKVVNRIVSLLNTNPNNLLKLTTKYYKLFKSISTFIGKMHRVTISTSDGKIIFDSTKSVKQNMMSTNANTDPEVRLAVSYLWGNIYFSKEYTNEFMKKTVRQGYGYAKRRNSFTNCVERFVAKGFPKGGPANKNTFVIRVSTITKW